MIGIYGDMTKIMHSLLDLGGGTSYPTLLYLFIFPSVSGINRKLVLGETLQCVGMIHL